MQVRIGLIHATRISIDPSEKAFAEAWSEASTQSLLDESLIAERRRVGQMTPGLFWRIAALARLSLDAGSQAILYTCSAFGPAIEAAARAVPIPVLKPYTAMVEEALECGDRLGLVATFPASITELAGEVEALAAAKGQRVSLVHAHAAGAMEAFAAGDSDSHDARIAAAAKSLGACDAIMLAQFSMARAKERTGQATGARILTAPASAVAKLKSLFVKLA
jgi:Asp/Glu/hydantoin racemase